MPNVHRLKNITDTLSNKPFSIWLLTTPPHVKYVSTLPCNLSLIACFADINVIMQGAVGFFNVHLTPNLPRNLHAVNTF